MPLTYTVARIFTSEEARHQGRPLYREIVELMQKQKISARCQVTKGIAGCYENGEVATLGVEVFSYNLPLEITVIMPQAESARLLPMLEAMVDEGLMMVEEKEVHWHKFRKQMIPRQVRVKDVMTPGPRVLPPEAAAAEALRIFLASPFHGIPVVGPGNRPVGMVTHRDLLARTMLPIKVGAIQPFGAHHLGIMENLLAGVRVADLMSKPAVVVKESELLGKAVELMLKKDLKRLPVVAADGTLTGMLSRLDIFKTIMDRNPDWAKFGLGGVKLQEVTRVKDAMRTDTPTLAPSAPLWDAIKLVDSTGIRRVAVVDPDGRLLGLISEPVLMSAFSAHQGGLLDLVAAKLSFRGLARRHPELRKAVRAHTVGEVMATGLLSVKEDDLIDDALRLMVEQRLKRLPVLDAEGRFKGMLTRDSLLRSMQPAAAE